MKKDVFNFDDPSDLPTASPEESAALFGGAEPERPPNISVPNSFPTIQPSTYRLAIIGEAPGQDEVCQLKPFVGHSGKFLDSILSKLNISRACCFVGNVCQIRPPENDISLFEFSGPEIQAGLSQLKEDLERFQPNLCILLGKTAFFAAKGTRNLTDWRGSFFISTQDGPFLGRKCIATYHPAACLRNYEWTPLLTSDIRKSVIEARYPTWTPPQRDLITNLSFYETVDELNKILLTKPEISCDIEGGVHNVSCISLSTGPNRSFIVPFTRLDGSYVWSVEEEATLWKLVANVMADRDIPKVWQNGLYDRFVLQWSHDILVRGNKEDTLLKFWESYCELDKDLGFQCSILTREPFYKADRKSTDQDTFYKYCCRDSAVTFENSQKLTPLLTPKQREHYQFNHDCLNFLLYAEAKGIHYNQLLANERLVEVKSEIAGLQNQLDEVAITYNAIKKINYDQPKEDILKEVQKVCCHVRDQQRPKKKYEETYPPICELLSSPETVLDEELKGTISILCGWTMNLRSPKFKDFLYGYCGLPTQYKKDPKTKELRPTTDYEALLKLSKNHNHPALVLSLDLSRLRTRSQMLAIRSHGGRMHCSYNLVGSETGRVTSSKSLLPAGGKKRVGANLQTVPDDWDIEDEESPLAQGMRDLFLSDEGHYLGKCDLKGSDGWTIGAYMAMLGDPTMLDDLKFGLKPAHFPAYVLKYGAENIIKHYHDRNKLKELFQDVKKDDWEYFVAKQGTWGTAYLMGARKLSERIFIESEGKVNLTEKQAKEFQASVFVRYKFKQLHEWMERFLRAQQYPAKFEAPNGFTRTFFGRNGGYSKFQKCEILGEALAHMPQVITTYATLKAAHRLWTDPENRILGQNNKTTLRIEPLHQVHDELLVQFKIEDTAWAISKLKSYFDNQITLAANGRKETITIPFDGAYGTAWSMDENHKVGEIK